MAFQVYDLATLLEVRRQQQGVPKFWRNFFTRQINFESQYIDFEVVSRVYRKMAPFVAPNVQGRVLKSEGSTMRRFAPAYVKPKSVIDPNKVIHRQVGETLYQPMSNAQRRLAVIAEETKLHKVGMENREEWMAARAIIDGKVIISGEDYPTSEVDFMRDASLTGVLSGGALWSAASTADPLGDIKVKRQRVHALTGITVKDIIFGQAAWNAFAARLALTSPTTGNLLDTSFRGSETNVSRVVDGFEGAEYVGRISGANGQGAFSCWVYSGFVQNDTGADVQLMSTNDVVGVGAIDGVICYGAIQDASAGYRAISVFMKNYMNEDPSVEYLLSQSAPLLVPAEPNASFKLTVLA
jgi:hypothetical protein